MPKIVARIAKLALSAGLVVYLLTGVSSEAFDLLRQPKDWPALLAGFALCGAAICLTFIRWGFLVRALGLPLPTWQAFRIGALGYLCNLLAPFGAAGGDGLKVALLSWRVPGGLARSLASVLIDRLIGLYTLFVLASLALLYCGLPASHLPALHTLSLATVAVTLIGAGMILALLLAPISPEPLDAVCARIPLLGRQFTQFFQAILLYRNQPRVLAAAAAMSLGVHVLFATGVYCIACALPGATHTYAQHLVIVPLSATAGVLPLPVGPFEWVLETLYTALPLADGGHVAAGRGLLIALGYRLATLSTACAGVLLSTWIPTRLPRLARSLRSDNRRAGAPPDLRPANGPAFGGQHADHGSQEPAPFLPQQPTSRLNGAASA